MNQTNDRYLFYDVPDFVKNSPNYMALFERETTILQNAENQWGIHYGSEPAIRLSEEKVLKKVTYDYATFFEAYYDAQTRDCTIWFSNEIARLVFGTAEDENSGNIADIMFSRKSGSNYRMIFRNHGDYRVQQLENDYHEWQILDAEMDESCFTHENLLQVHSWLASHPNFWKETVTEKQPYWQTEDISLKFIDIFPLKDDDTKEVYWLAEGGYHVLDENEHIPYASSYYHDLALDATGNTYEEALLGFAKNVWLQSHGLLKEREEARDAWMENLMKNSEDEME